MEERNHRFAAFCEEKDIVCLKSQPMREYTSFKIGGPAEVLAKPSTATQVCDLMCFCAENDVAPFIIGNGSDLLVSDAGITRPVIQIGPAMAYIRLENDVLICGAGSSLAVLCVFAREHSLTGLEFAYGIPGNLGGAIFMNAGAYSGELKDALESITYVTREGKLQTLAAADCRFGYRHSIFAENGGCIVEASFRLPVGQPEEIRARMEDLMARRKEKQPLEYPSAGSTFKRPVGGYASALIDQCGLKGLRVGGAMVSAKHAGFLINYEDATCVDVLALVKRVQDAVSEQTGFRLECEIQYVE